MKIGDLVRYKNFPHEELHNSGLTGLVLTESYFLDEPGYLYPAPVVNIMWSMDRGSSHPSWDYVDEIEVVSYD